MNRKRGLPWRALRLSLLIVAISLVAVEGDGQNTEALKTPASTAFLSTLSEQERTWLRDHPVIRVVQDPGWPPIEFANEHGEPSGMAEDYVRLIEQRLGMKFVRVCNLSWQEAYAQLKRHEIDMTTSVAMTPERAQFWAFTKPYMTIPITIATRADVTYIAHMRELAGKKVAVVAGYAVNDWIPRDFPEIQLVRVKTAQEGLEALQRRDVFAYIDCLLIVGYYQAQMKITNIKIAGETPYVNAQSMAVRNDWAPLAGILQKALDSTTEMERNDIYRRWLPIRYEHGESYTLLWRALAIFAAMLTAMIVWNRKLAKEIAYRKKMETAVNQSERRLNEAERMAHLGHWIWNVKTGDVEWSEEVFRIFRLDPKEFTPQIDSILALSPWPEEHERDKELIRQAIESHEQGAYEQRFLRPDKSIGYYHSTFQGIYDASGDLVSMVGTVQDITDRKKAEEALRESEERFSMALEVGNAGVWEWDRDNNVVSFDERFHAILGYTPGELPNTIAEWLAYHHQEEIPVWSAKIEAYLRGDSPFYESEHRVRTKTGAWNWLFTRGQLVNRTAQGTPGRFMGIAMNVTVRKQTELERERLMTAIEQAAETIVITDPAGIIQYVNPAFERVTGYTRDEALGQNPRLLNSGTQDATFYRGLWETIAGGNTWTGQMVNKRKNATLYTEEVTISPVRDTLGKIVNYVAVKRDITHDLELEQQILQAQKMEAIGQLAGGVAHDFNNILQAIMGYSNMLLQNLADNDECYDFAMEIARSTERAAALTRQLLLFGRRQIMQPKNLDLNLVIGELLKMLRRVIGEDIQLQWRPGKRLGAVHADAGMMEQVLMNLCVNARDAMAKGGTLTIETQNVLIDAEYCNNHTWATAGRFVLLSVTDTGCGMDKETIKHIFEPFFTTKEVGKGTGLGLATVYGIVRQHGGMVTVYSEPDKGTTFKVYLPVCEHKAVVLGPMIESPVVGGNETILLAEDDEHVRALAVRTLREAGYTIIEAANGQEALALFLRNANRVALLLLDVVMPNMGGYDAFERIRAIRPDIPVLFSSGYTENAVHTNFVLNEGLRLLQKPYAPDTLLRGVREVLDQAVTARE